VDVRNVQTSYYLCLQLQTHINGEILQAFIVSPIQPIRQACSKTLTLTTIKYYEKCKHLHFIDLGSFTAEECDRISLGGGKREMLEL